MREIKYKLISKGIKKAYKEGKTMGFQEGNHPKTEFKKGNKPWNKNLTKETDERLLKATQKQSKAHVGEKWTEERKKNHKNGMKGLWQNRNHPKGTKGKTWKVKDTSNIKKANKKKWQNPEFVSKQMKSRNVTPNKTEKFLEKVLNKILPKEYKFVGDGKFILAGKCPDFLNINGKKKLIELFGSYWHRNDNPRNRINLFKDYGYSTLVIWENELKDLIRLKEKILEFNIQKE